MDNLPAVTQPSGNPLDLIRLALDKGLDPEKLGKLYDLQERWEKARAAEAFNDAMAIAQSKLKTVAFNSTNPQTSKPYTNLAGVLEVATPIFTDNGLSLSFHTAALACA